MPKAIHAMKSREASASKAESVAAELESMRLKEAAKVVCEGFAKTLTHCEMPREHWRRIRTNNATDRLNREIRRRTRVVGTFPDGKSALILVAARPKYVADSEWGIAPLPGCVASQGVAVPAASRIRAGTQETRSRNGESSRKCARAGRAQT